MTWLEYERRRRPEPPPFSPPPRYVATDLSSAPKSLRETAARYVAHFATDGARGRAPLFLGPTGSWKTTVACWTLEQIWREHRVEVQFCSVPSDIAGLRMATFADVRKRVDVWSRVPVLLLDDFGVITTAHPMFDTLRQVVAARFDALRPTLVTANVTLPKGSELEGLEKLFEPMVARRLWDGGEGYTVMLRGGA